MTGFILAEKFKCLKAMKQIRRLLTEQNQFFELAKQARRLPNVWISLLVFIGIFVLSAGIAGATTELFFGKETDVYNFWRESYLTLAIFSGMFLWVFVWLKIYEKRNFSSIGFIRKEAFKKYMKGFVLGIVLVGAIVGMMILKGAAVTEIVDFSVSSSFIIGTLLIALVVFVIQGAGEEVLFRGWLMQVVGVKYKPWIGMLVSLLIFAAMHMGNNGINLLTIINLVLYTLVLILYILKEGSIWGVCGFHSSWNWAVSNIFGFEISGSHPYGSSIINLETAGDEIFSGGAFGPEASIFATLVIAIVLVYFILKK